MLKCVCMHLQGAAHEKNCPLFDWGFETTMKWRSNSSTFTCKTQDLLPGWKRDQEEKKNAGTIQSSPCGNTWLAQKGQHWLSHKQTARKLRVLLQNTGTPCFVGISGTRGKSLPGNVCSAINHQLHPFISRVQAIPSFLCKKCVLSQNAPWLCIKGTGGRCSRLVQGTKDMSAYDKRENEPSEHIQA